MKKLKIPALVGRLFGSVFGHINWVSPPWLAFLREKLKGKSKLILSFSLFILFLISLYSAYQYYHQRPEPLWVKAQIKAPGITANQDTLQPDNLIIDFSSANDVYNRQAVAPLQEIHKTVSQGIELSPAIPGSWVWQSDSELVFTPSKDWPAGQKYQLHFSPELFNPKTMIKDFDYSFSTQSLRAKITEFSLYQDPTDPLKRQAVATFEFNFPVDEKSLAKNTHLRIQNPKGKKIFSTKESYKFSLDYDKNKRKAYLKSENIAMTDEARFLQLELDEGIDAASKTSATWEPLSKELFIPDRNHYFKVSNINALIVRNQLDKPEQILNLETSLGVSEKELQSALKVYLLPKDYPGKQNSRYNYHWTIPGEVTPSILALSEPLDLQLLPSDSTYASLHSFKFKAPVSRYLYVYLPKGARSFGDFPLASDYRATVPVPAFPQELSFLHKGSLLALNSEKRLSVLVRGLPAVKFEIARVLPENINQLVTQTRGDFNDPRFINWQFNEKNISEIFSEIRHFNGNDLSEQQYTALDLGLYLKTNAVKLVSPKEESKGLWSRFGQAILGRGQTDDASIKQAAERIEGGQEVLASANQGLRDNLSTKRAINQGLFLLKAKGWDDKQKEELDIEARRLILLTDLALIVKDSQNETHDVFVQSITTGKPLGNVDVSVLGKNGLSLMTEKTDSLGHVFFPRLDDFTNDKEPVAYLAKRGDDFSFIPYAKEEQVLNYSRFEVGGLYHDSELEALSAYVFSDRGLYRPGDSAHIGVIVKKAYVNGLIQEVPVQVRITDPKGNVVMQETHILDSSGLLTLDFKTGNSSASGDYIITVYTVKDGYAQNVLGSTSIRVAEFQPDKMKIKAKFLAAETLAWYSPQDLKAEVSLYNLYGKPAENRRVTAELLLKPWALKFSAYPDYTFADPLLDKKTSPKTFTDTLKDGKTNAQGEVIFDLNLSRFAKASYELSFLAQGFEADSGRNVATQVTALVSPLPYFVGYKSDTDLNYLKFQGQASVEFIAIDAKLKPLNLETLSLKLYSVRPINTLVKQENGTYKYQSLLQEKLLATQAFKISTQGSSYVLPTNEVGNFILQIEDENHLELSHLRFSVAGSSELSLAKNAELSLKLDKTDYQAGDEIEVQLIAPYAGSGLITLERDKVYATQWFEAKTTTSVQKIRIPADFQGDGYVNVAYVRSWDSPERFINPLSYAVMPFKVKHEDKTIQVALDLPERVKPGEPLTIAYKSDKPAKLLIFAVDEGILQVARYQSPDPLSFFFRKYALEVQTKQTLDQILPEYLRDKELSSVAGDAGEESLNTLLNPFKRKVEAPVVYWSGLLDSNEEWQRINYLIPDYFNGSLKVMAVAVAAQALGSEEKSLKVSGDFVLNPNPPTFVAPNDEFELSVSLANQVKGSGTQAKINLSLESSPELELLSPAQQTELIPEGGEKVFKYKLKAKDKLGSAELRFKAWYQDKSASLSQSLSIRPATNFSTSLQVGSSKEAKVSLNTKRALYPAYAKVQASVSSSPLILAYGLKSYLDNYPYGCTEQLISKAFPLLALMSEISNSKQEEEIREKVAKTLQVLSQRQVSSGGFSYWPEFSDTFSSRFASVYAMHFLTDLPHFNLSRPAELFSSGLSYLKALASATPSDLTEARIEAYAIYVLTLNEVVTSSYLTHLQAWFESHFADTWQQDVSALYLAASYQLLQDKVDANRLLDDYASKPSQTAATDFYDAKQAQAVYLYILARHFPEKLAKIQDTLLFPLIQTLNSGEINTIFASYLSLGLAYLPKAEGVDKPADFKVTQVLANGSLKPLQALYGSSSALVLDYGAQGLNIDNPGKGSFFYQLSEEGFDKQLPEKSNYAGIEIYREYRDLKTGTVLSEVKLGTEIVVHIQVRAQSQDYLTNVAIVDLLPGGFEIVPGSVSQRMGAFIEAREDRTVFFTSIGSQAEEIIYRLRATNVGDYTTPGIFAQSMYASEIKGQGAAGQIKVVD